MSDEAKSAAALAAGAEQVVAGYGHLPASAADFTDVRGLDVIYDSVGGPRFPSVLTCARRRGTVVLYGSSGGQTPRWTPMSSPTLGPCSSHGRGSWTS
ncbi:zinc-binding dehydrogenase [Streptomyces sp. NPDC021098]|uniref:zinc-binding dehydrogenase n=1 Tax=unclassified Streptomyces TaxID=2593676 RepID=UPI003793FCCC